MFLRLAQIFTRHPIDGPDGYDRGFANARRFIAEKPDELRLKGAELSCDPPMDDYDRGYADGLKAF